VTVDNLTRRLVAEGLGTGMLLAAVVGSGIMAEQLSGGNVALALLANTLATPAALIALILTFGPISGAHFNPAVRLALALRKALPWAAVPGYLLAQFTGAVLGVWLAHAMFGLSVIQASAHVRTGFGQWVGEFTATFALLSVIWSCTRHHPHATPYAVASIITAAYWFTSSTSFANPAVTIARALSDTFAGIRPHDAPAFVIAQLLGAFTATALFAWFADELPAIRRPLSGPSEAIGEER
jgi:glycerol uptake facilitator-like aquaporin